MYSKLKCYGFSLPIWSICDFRYGTGGPRKSWFLWILWTSEIHLRTHSLSFQERSGGQESYADAIQMSRRAVCLKRNSRAGGDLLKSWHWQACGICTQTRLAETVRAPSSQAIWFVETVRAPPSQAILFCGRGVYRCQWSIRNPDNWDGKVEN